MSSVFGNLENVDMSDVPQKDPENLDPQEFNKMAMQMAQNMKPQDMIGLQNYIQNMPLDTKMISILIRMKQYQPLKVMLQGKEDPQLVSALQLILGATNDATKTTKRTLAQLVLSIRPRLINVSVQHAQAKVLLEQACFENTKSAKSIKLRAKRERVRKRRTKKKK